MIKFAGFNAILMKQKIIYKTIAAAALILSAAVSCEWVDKVITGETVASVGKVRREFDTLKSKIFDRVRSELFFLSNLFYIFVVYISKYRKYETFN